VAAKEGLTIPPRSTVPIPLVHTAAYTADTLLFEPADSPVSLFSCLADSNMSNVLTQNDSDQPVDIPIGFTLGSLIPLDAEHCFQVATNEQTSDLAALALRGPTTTRKAFGPQAMQPPETVHHTGVTIYGDQPAVDAFDISF
jgi:hypothetical protein